MTGTSVTTARGARAQKRAPHPPAGTLHTWDVCYHGERHMGTETRATPPSRDSVTWDVCYHGERRTGTETRVNTPQPGLCTRGTSVTTMRGTRAQKHVPTPPSRYSGHVEPVTCQLHLSKGQSGSS